MVKVNEANEQQKQFVNEYLKLRKKNQTQAAINAGYSPKTASSQSSQLLNNPKVLEYLKSRESQIEKGLREEFLFDALEAREVMFGILNSEYATDKDKITVAKDFLDRAGFRPVEKSEVSATMEITNPYEGLTTEELRKLARSEKYE